MSMIKGQVIINQATTSSLTAPLKGLSYIEYAIDLPKCIQDRTYKSLFDAVSSINFKHEIISINLKAVDSKGDLICSFLSAHRNFFNDLQSSSEFLELLSSEYANQILSNIGSAIEQNIPMQNIMQGNVNSFLTLCTGLDINKIGVTFPRVVLPTSWETE